VASFGTGLPSSGPGLAVEVGGLRKAYGDRVVLRGVDFEVRQGEVLCLLGPNGAGKTTTVEILEGFRARTGGSVTVLGLDPAAQPAQLRERIGIVLQECGFPRQARVGELIAIWRDYYPHPRPLGDLLEVTGLSEDRNTPVRKLSGGQRRRLDFALALAGDPDLVFLDEPSTGFDPEARRKLWSAVENLRGIGKTIVLTTHYLDEAERLADRVAILLDGKIKIAGSTREVARLAALPSHISFAAPQALRTKEVPPPDGIELTVSGSTASCQSRTPAATLRALLDWAGRHQLGDLDELAVASPSLEDAYLHHVERTDGEPRA
jgi:ABC-2 type transport system ATP-binding protein